MNEREQIRAYVAKLLRENHATADAIKDDESLVLSGRLSSLDVVNVLTFLEGTFNFAIDPNDFDIARFDTVDSIVGMLHAPR